MFRIKAVKTRMPRVDEAGGQRDTQSSAHNFEHGTAVKYLTGVTEARKKVSKDDCGLTAAVQRDGQAPQ